MDGTKLLLLFFLIFYGLAMLFILLYSFTQASLVWRYLKQKKKKEIAPTDPMDWPKVTIQLPVYNELYVVERLIEAAANIKYPKDLMEIQVLDDSNDESVLLIENKVKELRGQCVDIHHIRREERTDFKAGALKYGLEIAKCSFVAIFDADFIPPEDFLLKTIPYFQDKQLGVVQTRWGHLNKDYSLLTYLQAFALDAHFTIEQVGRNQKSCFINFNGTGGVWRKSCIQDAGNWEADTLTEDLDLSYRAQLKGWKFKYLENVLSPAELPPVMSALKSQQYRWTKGGAETAKKHLKSIFKAKLSWGQKWHGIFHLLNSTVFVSVIVAAVFSVPLLFLKQNWPIVDQLFWVASIFFLSFIIIAVMYFISFSQSFKRKDKALLHFLYVFPLFLSVSMGLSVHNAIAVIEGFFGKKTAFIRTPKFNLKHNGPSWSVNKYMNQKLNRVNYIEILMLFYFVFAVIFSIAQSEFGMLPFHLMLVLGFGTVNFYTFQQLRKVKTK